MYWGCAKLLSNIDLSKKYPVQLTIEKPIVSFCGFYKLAFSHLRSENGCEKVYRLFIGRFCKQSAFTYLNENRKKIDDDILEQIYTENNYFFMCKEIADDFFVKSKKYPDSYFQEINKKVIFFCDYISNGEYLQYIYQNCLDLCIKYLEKNLNKNGESLCNETKRLFKEKVKKIFSIYRVIGDTKESLLGYDSIGITSRETCTMNEKEREIFLKDVSESLSQSTCFSNSFLPIVWLKKEKIKYDDILKATLNDDLFLRNDMNYMDSKMTSFIYCRKNAYNIKAFFIMRCTENYIAPFIATPKTTLTDLKSISKSMDRNFNFKSITFLNKFNEYMGSNNLSEEKIYFFNVINTVFNILFLRAFFNMFNLTYNIENTNIDNILINIKDKELCNAIEDLLSTDFELKNISLSSVADLFFGVCLRDDAYAFKNKINAVCSSCFYSQKAIQKIEKTIFDYLKEEQINKNTLFSSLLYKSTLSKNKNVSEKFVFPRKNTISDFLIRVFRYKSSWVCNEISIPCAIGFLLFFYDLGYIDIYAFQEEGETKFDFCIKPMQTAYFPWVRHYFNIIPLIDEVKKRCFRMSVINNEDSSFSYKAIEMEFESFFKNYVSLKTEIVKKFKNVFSLSLLDSSHSTIRYILKELVSSPEEFDRFGNIAEAYCSNFEEQKDFCEKIHGFCIY